MNWKNVRLIFQREFRDQIRDRRTLFMVVVLPLILYPGLTIGMLQVSFLVREQPRTVVMIGTANLPAKPALLDGESFSSEWLASSAEVGKLRVVADTAPLPADKEAAKQDADLLAAAGAMREPVEKLDVLQRQFEAAEGAKNEAEVNRLSDQIHSLRESLADKFSATKMQVLIMVPTGLARRIEDVNRAIAERKLAAIGPAASKTAAGAFVIHNSADEKSTFAYQRVKQILAAWEQRILQDRLSEAKLPPTLSTPVNTVGVDVAVASQLSASLWSKLFPTLLIIMAVTGAFYPAVDVAAGEKERGTMETLLICPARRSEIVMGKFFSVLSFSVATVLLNLASMGLTGKYFIAAVRSDALTKIGAGALSFPGAWEILWLLILLLPLAAFYSAVSLALATFARSTKEGQYYLTPLLLVTLGLTLLCLTPAVEIEPFYSILPVVGPALLLKEILASPGNTAVLVYAVPVLVSSIGYSLIGLWGAIAMFNREDVLFREAERFDLRLWLKHLLRDKESTPSASEAVLCFVLVLLLQFGLLRFMGQGLVGPNGQLNGIATMKLLITQQVVIIAFPALLMGLLLTTSVARTFRLRLPGWQFLLFGVLLPVCLHPLTIWLESMLAWFFPPLPKQIVELMEAISGQSIPLWLVHSAMALAPGICEETAFRGFILSGFLRSARPGVAILLSSVAFGIVHMIPQQVFGATLLGLVLGLLAFRSGSLLPGIIFHAIFNSLELLRERVSSIPLKEPIYAWFVTIRSGEPNGTVIEYNWPLLVIAGIAAAWMIRRLILWRPESMVNSSPAAAENLQSDGSGEKIPDKTAVPLS